MQTRTLVRKEHEEMGFSGFVVKGMDFTDPGTGMTIAHDLLEHSPADRGTIEEELMALGAAMYVRGEDYWNRSGSYTRMPENIASDFPMFNEHFQNNFPERDLLLSPGRTTKLDLYMEESIQETCFEVLKAFKNNDEKVPAWVRDTKALTGWFRRGYRKAVRRYAPMRRRGGMPLEFFLLVEQEIDKKLRHAELGDEFKLLINLRAFRFEILEPDYGY